MSTKYFIWIVHVSMRLREFLWNFCDFRSIFRAFKHFLDFFWNCFALKINSKKQILSNWAEPKGPTQVCSSPPGPREAHRPLAEAATAGGAVASWGSSRQHPYIAYELGHVP
jgi:hypothetical protein